jgi:Sec-independent protein translocase protein TatA
VNIFGLGGAELVVIIVIMLVVAGPTRMVSWAYIMGQWIARFRLMWEQAVDTLQDEVNAAGLDVEIPRELPTRNNLNKFASAAMKPYADELQKEMDNVAQPLRDTVDEVDGSIKNTWAEQQALMKNTDRRMRDRQQKRSQLPKRQPAQGAVANSQPKAKPDPAEPETSDSNFGAWSNPKSPAEKSQAQTDASEVSS